MTENEALKIAIHCLGVQAEQEVCEECPVYRESGIVCKEIARTAITALKEIQQYRKIGTVEECREAVEKQKTKMVINGKLIKNFYGRPYYIKGDCPTCGRESIKSTDTDYCYVCGQHLKWDENLREMESEEE